LRWASKAATVAYTFDFVNYNTQTAAARPYFTEDGWQDYLNSVNNLINTIVQNQLFVNGVVSGAPVISNQGNIPGRGYVWRVQIPFLVTYQSANTTSKQNYFVIISIVKVPTYVNKQGIGIDQFVMV
jgi:intracellular multiplication protein IcmL